MKTCIVVVVVVGGSEAYTNFNQPKRPPLRLVETAVSFHRRPSTSLTSTSFHRLHYSHVSQCGSNIFYFNGRIIYFFLGNIGSCSNFASMDAYIDVGCGRPVGSLGSGWLVGLQRLLRTANYMPAPCGWEQDARWEGLTAGSRYGSRYQLGAGCHAGAISTIFFF